MFNDPGDNIGPKSCDLWKPVIAAVNGMACGGAFYMLGEVEFIIAAEHATFFDPHVTYGMCAAFEPIHMAGIMPFPEIMRLSLLGNYERMSAARAHQIGMVSEVVPGDRARGARARDRGDHRVRSRSSRSKAPCARSGRPARCRSGKQFASATRTSRWAPAKTPSPRARSSSPPASGSTGSCVEGNQAGRARRRGAFGHRAGRHQDAVRAPLSGRVTCDRRRGAHQERHRRPGIERHRAALTDRDRRVPRSAAHLGRRHRCGRRDLGVHGRARHRRDHGRPRRGGRARLRLDHARRPQGSAPRLRTSRSAAGARCSSTRRSATR